MVDEIKVGNVYVDGVKIVYVPPGIPPGVKWMHVIPKKYNHSNLPKSFIFCFTNTVKGRAAMLLWLTANKLADIFLRDDALLEKIKNFISTKRYKKVEKFLLRRLRENIRRDTQEYLDLLTVMGIDPWAPNVLQEINTPESMVSHSDTHCSKVFKENNYGDNPGQEATTENMMLLADKTFIPILKSPPWPTPGWDDEISSAQVDSGCLRLFDLFYYGGIQLFLWGPLGYYPYLEDFAFDNRASSIQQSP